MGSDVPGDVFELCSEDWAEPHEREHDRDLVPGAKMVMVAGGRHFLALDRPQAVVSHVKDFIG